MEKLERYSGKTPVVTITHSGLGYNGYNYNWGVYYTVNTFNCRCISTGVVAGYYNSTIDHYYLVPYYLENTGNLLSFSANSDGNNTAGPNQIPFYARAYVITADGIFYSDNAYLSMGGTIPNVSTTLVSLIGTSYATSGGSISSDGGNTITDKGIIWGYNSSVALDSYIGITHDGNGSSSYTSYMSGLTPGTIYYVKAYATTTIGTGYGKALQFTTQKSVTVPNVTTNVPYSISQTSAYSGGSVSYTGGGSIIERGICFNTVGNPNYNNSKTLDGTGTGNFTSFISSLIPNTLYYVRAYAKASGIVNSFTVSAVGYGQEEIFYTTSYSDIIATLSSSFVSEYPDIICVKWIVTLNSSASTNITIPILITNETNTGNVNHSINILSGQSIGSISVNYYKQSNDWTAYANFGIMPTGYSGSNTASYIIPKLVSTPILPIVTTSDVSTIGTTTAIGGGDVTSDGNGSISSRGVCYIASTDISINPTISNLKTIDGSGIGLFTSNLSGLANNTYYRIRAYATNEVGTAYGDTISFKTNSDIVINNPSVITYSKQVDIGNIISSVEISNDGVHLYLLYPTLKIIRNHTLSTPFNISTISSYQDYDLSILNVGTSCGGLYLSPDNKKLTFIDGHDIKTIELSVANDLSTEIVVSSYNISTTFISGEVDSVIFDPTGYYCTISGYMVGSQRRTVTFSTSYPFQLSGTITYINLSTMLSTGYLQGIEWDKEGNAFYSIDSITGYINKYPISSTPYIPTITNNNSSGAQSIYIENYSYYDFCFNNTLTKLYTICHAIDADKWYVLEFNMS